MPKIAFLFPGQGAQYVGMGKEYYDNYKECRERWKQASDLLGIDMEAICFEKQELLDQTEYTQAALVTVSEAIRTIVVKQGITADVCAGLSLGEYGALIASGAMKFEDAIRVVRKRGMLMQHAVEPGKGKMAAVLGLPAETIEHVLSKINGPIGIANYNCPGQIVITGETACMDLAIKQLQEAGARRVLPLNVSGPFHSPMLYKAGKELEKTLAAISLQDPVIPYVRNIDATYVTRKDNIKDSLVEQVYSPVKFEQSIRKMLDQGIDTFIELGPGKTLSTFVKKIDRTVTVINIEKPSDLEALRSKEELYVKR